MKRVVDQLLRMVLVGLLLASANAFAGRGDKVGTGAAPELLIPVGARYVGMGNASASLSTGVDAIYWNPAGLSRTTTTAEAMFSYMRYIADIGVNYAAVSASFEGVGSIGLSMKQIAMGDIEITTEGVPDGTGQFFSPTFITVGLTYSRLLTDRISVGLTGNVISERIDRVSASGIAFDIGVQYSSFANVNGLNVGVVVKNIGPNVKFDGPGLYREATATGYQRPATYYKVEAATDELPSTIELAVSYQQKFAEEHALTFAGVFQNNNLSEDDYKLGLEYGFNDALFLRGGYIFGQETQPDSRIYGASFGAGLHHSFGPSLAVSIDYAYRAVKYLDGNHVFTLKLGF